MPNKEPSLVLDVEDYHMKLLTKLESDFTTFALMSFYCSGVLFKIAFVLLI